MAKTFKVVRKPSTDEWVVKVYNNGKYSEAETYYTNDKTDALHTLKAMKDYDKKHGIGHITAQEILKVNSAESDAEDACTTVYRGKNKEAITSCQAGVSLFRRELRRRGFATGTMSGKKRRR